jgi:hypothetical protein
MNLLLAAPAFGHVTCGDSFEFDDLLSSPTAKAVLAGIAAMVVKRTMAR